MKTGLDFFGGRCKLAFGTALRVFMGVDSKLISLVISAKVRVNRPSINIALLLQRLEYQQGTIVSLCLAGRFSVRLWSRFLVGPTRTRMGSVRLFFVLGCHYFERDIHLHFNSDRCLVRRIVNSPEAAQCSCPIAPPVILSHY